jgi:hypothetical protein
VTGELRDAVDEATAALPLQPQDVALKVYALQLADLIDERHRVAAYAAAAITAYDESNSEDVDVYEALTALRAKLSERETLDRLGTNLHKVLVELGASPRARAEGKAPKTPLGGPGADPLSLLRGGKVG